ncbi:MAG TPA: sigma-54 dependent transcriptional regulator [Arenimonas sp.]|nr:sigma-54 dependent transcriptional regulator [Arenimonas sp.]
MANPTILVIDDNPAVYTALELLFSLHGIDCRHAATPEQGLAVLGRHPIDLVIQDMNFSEDTTSGVEGAQLFHAIRTAHPDLPVILLTAWTHLATAVELVKAGAADYLGKPWDDQRLLATVNTLLELAESNRELARRAGRERQQRRTLEQRYDLRGYVFADPASERVISLACQVARSEVPVLIRGDNGSGKEGIAAIIQANSAVADGPFVTLDCGALPSELIEAELFGAEAGAYTGSSRGRAGKFEAADGGTLFLDEIGNLPPDGQAKLLRVLETGRFARLGSTQERQVKLRILSATNADLPGLIAKGSFRQDLYYRLNVIEIVLPPLADRPLDILPLARHFLPRDKHLGEAAVAALLQHDWPGNVRELRNVMQRAALLGHGERIEADELGLPQPRSRVVAAAVEPERDDIEQALQRAGGNIAQAASELGLSRQALYRRLQRLGIERP